VGKSQPVATILEQATGHIQVIVEPLPAPFGAVLASWAWATPVDQAPPHAEWVVTSAQPISSDGPHLLHLAGDMVQPVLLGAIHVDDGQHTTTARAHGKPYPRR
jgi:hypothetical protein